MYDIGNNFYIFMKMGRFYGKIDRILLSINDCSESGFPDTVLTGL